MNIFLNVDVPILLMVILTSFCCSLLGSFLVLRRQAMMVDALSHVVLLGIVLAFLLTGTIEAFTMVLGALCTSLLAIFLIGWIERFGGMDTGTAMGVVFTIFFALGLVLLEVFVGSRVHLDAQHALYGALETIIWVTPRSWESLLDGGVWMTLPRQIKTLGVMSIFVVLFVVFFYRALKVTSFDRDYARCMGISLFLVDSVLLVMVTVVVVGSFEAVGVILVMALFICPAAAARMLTDRLVLYVVLSGVLGVLSGVLGYICAAWLPLWLGGTQTLATAGMIAVIAGVIQLVMMIFAPRYGILAQKSRSFLEKKG